MVGACLSINAETLERTSISSLVNKYIVKVKRYIVQFLHNLSNLKLEARKIYMHKQSYLPVGKSVTLLTCAIINTAQYQEGNPPVAKLGKKIKTYNMLAMKSQPHVL